MSSSLHKKFHALLYMYSLSDDSVIKGHLWCYHLLQNEAKKSKRR